MASYSTLSSEQAQQLLSQGQAVMVDIRDDKSYLAAHASGAEHLTNDNLWDFLQQTSRSTAVIVMCYHGISSQSAAKFLAEEQGFQQVYSLEGGFEAWEKGFPVTREQ
jgi:thiosulfate sulfurtransferase